MLKNFPEPLSSGHIMLPPTVSPWSERERGVRGESLCATLKKEGISLVPGKLYLIALSPNGRIGHPYTAYFFESQVDIFGPSVARFMRNLTPAEQCTVLVLTYTERCVGRTNNPHGDRKTGWFADDYDEAHRDHFNSLAAPLRESHLYDLVTAR